MLDVVYAHSSLLSATMTGSIWALWHWPFILAEYYQVIPSGTGYVVTSGHLDASEGEILYPIVGFTLTLVGSRIIMCWMQGPNSSVIWTSVVYHASHNLYVVSDPCHHV